MRLAAICLLAGCQKPGVDERLRVDPSAVPLLDAWAEARGGRARLAAQHVTHAKGTCTDSGIATGFEWWHDDRGRTRELLTIGAFHTQTVLDGQDGWAEDASGLVIRLDGAALDHLRTAGFVASDSALVPTRLPGSVTKASETTLRLVPDAGEAIEVALDPATHLPRMSGGTELSDWREVDGIRFPFTSRTTDETTTVCTLASLDHEDGTFEPPRDRNDDVRFTAPQPVVVPLAIGSTWQLQASASIDGAPARPLIVDSGAPLLLDPDRMPELALRPTPAQVLSGKGFQDTTGFVGATTIGFPGLVLGPYTARTVSLAKHYPGEDAAVAGLLGAELFEHLVVEIDYPGHAMRLFDPATYHHPDGGTQLAFTYVERSPVIEATLQLPAKPALAMKLEVDTGCEYDLFLMRELVDAHHIEPRLSHDGTSVVVADGLQIGGARVDRPITAFATTANAGITNLHEVDGLLCGGALRHFRVTFDYPARTIWLDQ